MKTIKQAALDLYKPPFKFEHGYIFDGEGNMVADNGGVDEMRNAIALRLRGWGCIGYVSQVKGLDPLALECEIGKHCAAALTKYWEASRGD